MNWRKLFNDLFNGVERVEIAFFDPITDAKILRIKEATGVEISGQLLDLLLQTDGIKNAIRGDYFVYDTEHIIKNHRDFSDNLKLTECKLSREFLFFIDDGCGNYFGYETKNGKIVSPQVGFLDPIALDEYIIVAPDLFTWAEKWYTGKLDVMREGTLMATEIIHQNDDIT